MSAQKPGDRQQNKGNVSKKRSSVAARMASNNNKLKDQRDDQIIITQQMAHIQDHPLLTRGPASSGSNSRRNNSRTNMCNSFNQKNYQTTKLQTITKTVTVAGSGYGAEIPEAVMEDLLFRFLNNIPDAEKNVHVRVCFQIEQAHWFYVDFYCAADKQSMQDDANPCKKLGFREFARQVFYKCDFLQKWRDDVEAIIDDFRLYKSNVPTYGVILLDQSLNYVLLVQGYYSSKNNWGFPKGKVNEDEIPIQCAIREVLEEVGFDATERIVSNCRPMQHFLNDTLIRLYIATDVPMDHAFEPHLRKEIRKISWFSVWDLPKTRFDDQGCKKLGLSPSNFYSVVPFVNGIQTFVKREQAKRQKPKITILRKDSSAFKPVVPKSIASSSISADEPLASSSAASMTKIEETLKKDAIDEFLFKPLCPDVDVCMESMKPQTSFTGETFLELFKSIPANNLSKTVDESCGTSSAEIKQPKALHSNLIINVYEAPPSTSNTPLPSQQQIKQQQQLQPKQQQLQKQQQQGSTVNKINNAKQKNVKDGQTQTETSDAIEDQEVKDALMDRPSSTATSIGSVALNHPSEAVKRLFVSTLATNPLINNYALSPQISTRTKSEMAVNGPDPVFVVQPCKAWSNFKFDLSQITIPSYNV